MKNNNRLTVKIENKLESEVKKIVNNYLGDDYTLELFINDLMTGGCQSGLISELVYYDDTVKFYNHFKKDINTLLTETLENTGLSVNELFGDKWDNTDPLALDQFNQNLLSWFAFEETTRLLTERQGLEI